MLVTINTDASYRDDLKVGAFSFWMVCNQGRHFGAGPLKGAIRHCNEAEFKAILNALHFLQHKSGWTGLTSIIINTDSQSAIDIINGGPTHKWATELLQVLKRTRKSLGVKIQARKVKAHSGIDEKRKWVNNWCDKSAKRALSTFIKNQNQ